MLRFERTDDPDVIKRVIAHPKLYNYVSDDSCQSREDFQPLIHPLIWYLLVFDGAELLGLFMFTAVNAVTFEAHTCLLPNAWGERAIQASMEVASWVWINTPYRRIITNVPQYNRLAARLAKSAGMSLFGVNPNSYLKNGKLFDQLMFGISKEP